jgi:hypothetical protein
MANFNTHLNTAVITTGLVSTALLSAQHINLNTALWLWFLGSIGGLLPDIDSDNSSSLDTIFNILAFSTVLLVIRYITQHLSNEISFIEMVLLPLVVYSMMRYVVRPIFEKITVHRGSCHSILFVIFIALSTVQITWQINDKTITHAAINAWLSGGFILMGGLIHLLLDEVYSVDFSNVKIKRSFGTAIKVAQFDNKIITIFTIVAIIALIYNAPPRDNIIKELSDWSKFQLVNVNLKNRLTL